MHELTCEPNRHQSLMMQLHFFAKWEVNFKVTMKC